ncbi:hypothetical protein SLS58_011161 [Diplodia intermedia]|uniref:Heterokaryon incompatibility domain-containing protein n=1 Tax=Diplodia intermedia TaxID=856260 RepID=A0ABR3T1Q3_9PEZI
MQVRFRDRRHASYEYEPLHEPNAIRLLRLGDEPDDTEDLHGTLIRTTLDRAPPYFALSYCWGKQKKNDTLFCDGKLLKITPSLAEAIRRLRTLHSDREGHPAWELEHRYFWIDQVCINQADADERSSQVQMMGRIYSSALRTLIWLGPDPDGIAPAGFGLARKILSMWQEETGNLGGHTYLVAKDEFDPRIAKILQRLGQEDGEYKQQNEHGDLDLQDMEPVSRLKSSR